MKINDVLNVLRKNLACICSCQDSVDVSTLFGNFEDSVKVGGKVSFETDYKKSSEIRKRFAGSLKVENDANKLFGNV